MMAQGRCAKTEISSIMPVSVTCALEPSITLRQNAFINFSDISDS